MFGFLSLHGKEGLDPFLNVKAAAQWVAQLPATDTFAAQQRVVEGLSALMNQPVKVDAGRLAALFHFDEKTRFLFDSLFEQYLAAPPNSSAVENKLWNAIADLVKAFEQAYEAYLQVVVANSAKFDAPQKALLLSRMMRLKSVTGRQRLFRFEQWIPGQWAGVHNLYALALKWDCADLEVGVAGGGKEAPQLTTVTREYVLVLLAQTLNSGNFTAAQIEAVVRWVSDGMPRLILSNYPLAKGFFVALAAGDGFRRIGQFEPAGTAFYFDPAPLQPLLHSLHDRYSARQAEEALEGKVDSHLADRLAVLHKLAALWAPDPVRWERRGDRVGTDERLKIARGFSEALRVLKEKPKMIDIAAVAEKQQTPGMRAYDYGNAGHIYGFLNTKALEKPNASVLVEKPDQYEQWQLRDRSVSGFGATVRVGRHLGLPLGLLIAVRPGEDPKWGVGVLRRIRRLSGEEVETGIELVGRQMVAVQLRGYKRVGVDNTGYTQGGVTGFVLGAPFDAMYIPPAMGVRSTELKTLILPGAEFSVGRQYELSTGQAAYTIRINNPLEKRHDWVWAAFDVLQKKSG